MNLYVYIVREELTMRTNHTIYYKSSVDMSDVKDECTDLIVTSPPYPMIEMWDDLFFQLNTHIKTYFDNGRFTEAFYLMHEELNRVWEECYRVLRRGGIICVNIGDATRSLGGDFQLYSNHTLINKAFMDKGLKPLPIILWRKPTNKPSKFMGSGMLPTNAYVTLEHEYILIFRKGEKRRFNSKDRDRYESAYFWEERNEWFSDVWTSLNGIPQRMDKTNHGLRDRSGAYPIELPYRLIAMFSSYYDTVLDPFWGMGTTSIASMMLKRNSIGYELVENFGRVFRERIANIAGLTSEYNRKRFLAHIRFIEGKTDLKHTNLHYGFDVVTNQETGIKFYNIDRVDEVSESVIETSYTDFVQ
jgi:modification methylase